VGVYQSSSNLPAPINEGSDPQTKEGSLTIQGNLITGSFTMAAGAEENKVLTTNASGVATWQIPAGGSLWTQTGNDIYYNTGNVGIGTITPKTKLDVAGAIKVGTQDTCNADTEGAMRYNSAKKKFEGCNGVSWKGIGTCGEAVTFTYKDSQVTYGTVYNPATGECWMDRNLGALQVATSQTDANAYGDLFQWGRLDDGHQTRTSETTATLSSSDNPGHSNFILAPDSPYDWRSPQNNNLWQGVSGINNPCPSGWRLPTSAEWGTERVSWSSNNSAGAFASPLKLTMAGYRSSYNANLASVGIRGKYWNSTVSGTNSWYLYFDSSSVAMYVGDRAYGFSVRCIKD